MKKKVDKKVKRLSAKKLKKIRGGAFVACNAAFAECTDQRTYSLPSRETSLG